MRQLFVAAPFARLAAVRSVAALAVAALAFAMLVSVLVAPVPSAYADEPQDTHAFTQRIVTAQPVLTVGQQTTIDVRLTCDNFAEYPMYAYASTICIDTNVLRIDAVQTRKGVDAFIKDHTSTDGKQGWSDVVVNFLSRKLSGETWQQNETVVTFVVTPVAAGNASAYTGRVNISNKTGMSHMPCALVNLAAPVSEPLPLSIESSPYTSASSFALVAYTETVPEGFVPCFAGNPFAWDGNRFVALVDSTTFPQLKSADFTLEERVPPNMVRGDANGNGVMNIIDAQIAYDVVCGTFADFSTLPMLGWLSCDMNGDGRVDAADAFAIQATALSKGAFA